MIFLHNVSIGVPHPRSAPMFLTFSIMKRRIFFVITLLLFAAHCSAGDTLRLTLDDAIFMARTRSLDAAVALDELRAAYWEYRSYKADLLPEVSFSATAPYISRSYNSYQNSDGSYTFVRNNYLQMNGRVNLRQNIWLTGGTLSLSSSLDYLKTLTGSRDKRYMSTPVTLSLSQPLFGVNNTKWNRRIYPVRYAEAKANFLSETEEITMNCINYFFGLLIAIENVNIARQNLDNAKKLYDVALTKRQMGKISENDVLQLRLNLLNEESNLTSYESSMRSALFSLRTFLNIDDTTEIAPVLPDNITTCHLLYGEVLDKAIINNPLMKNIERRRLQADYNVASAKSNLRQINLTAQVGYSGTDRDLHTSYNRLNETQIVNVGVSIPILDWGKRRGNIKVAESNREITKNRIEQEVRNFKNNLFVLVEQFNNQQRQLEIAGEADKIAERRYNTNMETFLIGKISTLNLNDAQLSKDQARRSHIYELQNYWYYYYKIRSITLWDFEHNCNIEADFEKLIKT